MNRTTMLATLLFGLLLSLSSFSALAQQDASQQDTRQQDAIGGQLQATLESDEFDSGDIVAANATVQSLNLADWLGPLAPVALSPFFGLACLSGLAIWGPEWMGDNALLSAAGPLQNQAVFAVFAALTLLTSIPRLTKVSKPFAQAIDQLESYSVIVILLVIKVVAGLDDGPTPQAAIIQFGFLSFTAETLLAIAMVINLFVINSVKFFFEVLIWLTPIPAVDAMFEIANKSIVAGLMALYAFSPAIATAVNLAVLFAALIVFRWVHRRLSFYRSVLVDLILPRLWQGYGRPKHAWVRGFVKRGGKPFVAKTRWRIGRQGERWTASQDGLFGKDVVELQLDSPPELVRGWVMHTLMVKVSEGEPLEFHVSRRYDGSLDEWLEQCGIESAEDDLAVQQATETARAEFA